MEIEIIQSTEENNLQQTKNFGIILNRVISNIKMCHWYSTNYNLHLIFGELYDDLTDLFDKLQEEVIGTTKICDAQFPTFDINVIKDENVVFYQNDEKIIENFSDVGYSLITILSSIEFNSFVQSIKSGINNTKEEIISRINKTNYLLTMVKL